MTSDESHHRDARAGDRWRVPFWLVIACAALWLLHVSQTSGPRIGSLVNFEALLYWLPLLREAAAQWRTGALPLWNPYQAFGTPLLATQQVAAAYPLNALYLVLDAGTAWLVSGFVHHVIAALGMFAFARTLRLSRPAALLGAATYAFSAVILEKYDVPDEFICFAWLPAMFAAAEALLAAPGAGAIARLAFVWALQILGGDAETIVRSALLLGAYVGVRTIAVARIEPRQGLVGAAAASIAAALALGVTALQWVPTLEMLQLSVREVGQLTPAQQGIFSAGASQLLADAPRSAPLALAFLGWWTWRRRAPAWFFGGAAMALGLLATGPVTPLFDVVRHLPTGAWFRAPMRFLNFWPLCVAPLAAAGAEELFAAGTATDLRRRLRIALVAAVLAFVPRLIAAAWHETLRGWLVTVAFDLLPVTLIAGVILVALPRPRGQPRRAGLALAFVLICLTPTGLYHANDLSPARAATLYGRHAELFAALRQESPARVLSLLPVPSDTDWGAWAKLGTYFEVPVLNDFEPLTSHDFHAFATALAGGEPAPAGLTAVLRAYRGEVAPPRARYDTRLLNLSGVRFVLVAPADEAALAQWFASELPLTPWRRSPDAVAYENRGALPRAFFVVQRRTRAATPNCLEQLRDPAFDPTNELLLDELPAPNAEPAPARQPARVRIIDYAPAAVRIEVASDEAGFVVLTDAAYPGWQATVDDGAASVARADCFFRAVAVPAGTHVVALRYAPQSIRIGANVSLAAVVLMIALSLGRRWIRR